MTYSVRRLGGPDVPAVREMLGMFGIVFDDTETYCHRQPSDEYLQQFLTRADAISIAAFDGNVIGGLVAYALRKFEQERTEIYIYDLAVAETHRRQGVATALIVELRRSAAEMGAYIIFVQADTYDAPAIALYESLGSREDVLHFDIQV